MSCRPCPAAAAGLAQATRLWPNRSTVSDGICGDPAHAARDSDHNPDSRGLAHAFDLTHDPGSGCDAHLQADKARLRAKAGGERRLKYVISNRRIASPDSSWNWTAYTGDNPHEHHAHFSIETSGENNTSPWYQTGGLSVADVGDILDALRNQGALTREVMRNQGELTRAAVEANGRANAIANRRAVWRAAKSTQKEIADGDAEIQAEMDANLAVTLAAIESGVIAEPPAAPAP